MKKVILIGGSPYSGKSYLARELAAKYKYACIPTDDLSWAVNAATLVDPMSGLTHGEYYLKYSAEYLIEHTTLLHQKMLPSLRAVVDAHSTWAYPAIIEGWSLYPEWVAALPYTNLDSLWLIASRDVLLSRIQSDEQFYSNCANPDDFVNKYLERSVWHNNKIFKTASSLGMKLININSKMGTEDVFFEACKLLQG